MELQVVDVGFHAVFSQLQRFFSEAYWYRTGYHWSVEQGSWSVCRGRRKTGTGRTGTGRTGTGGTGTGRTGTGMAVFSCVS